MFGHDQAVQPTSNFEAMSRALDAYRKGRDKWDEINNKDKK